MAGTGMLRQLFFGAVDMEIHARPAATPVTARGDDEMMATFRDMADNYTVMPPLKDDRFLCSFGHIFAGGYAAGYVLDAVCVVYTCRRLIDLSLIAGTTRTSGLRSSLRTLLARLKKRG